MHGRFWAGSLGKTPDTPAQAAEIRTAPSHSKPSTISRDVRLVYGSAWGHSSGTSTTRPVLLLLLQQQLLLLLLLLVLFILRLLLLLRPQLVALLIKRPLLQI